MQRIYGKIVSGSALYEKHVHLPDELFDEIIVAVGDEFISWYNSNPKDIGNTCRVAIGMAIANMSKGMSDLDAWKHAAIQTDKSLHGRTGGNGSLMRSVYPALYFRELSDATRASFAQSYMTHLSAEASDSCFWYTVMIHELLKMEPGDGRAWLRNKTYELSEDLLPQMHRSSIDPSGYVLDSFACALRAVNSATGFRESVCNAVNRGGDADTIGAITGSLAGALWGYESIPEEWIAAIDSKTRSKLDFLGRCAI